MTSLSLGIDLGTSGIRSAVLDDGSKVVATARAAYGLTDADKIDATIWWVGVVDCLTAQVAALRDVGVDPKLIDRIGIDGTSGSMVLTDKTLRPVSRALMYNSSGFDAEAQKIAAHAPASHITRGSNSALARLLRLSAEAGDAAHMLHQADFIAAKLMGRAGYSDHNNSLKTGFDPESDSWPDWFEHLNVMHLLPKVLPAGHPAKTILTSVADQFGLSPDVTIHIGTTDSIAAFLAAAPLEDGAAVTSLGTTLAVKMLSDVRIDAPEIGLYSHKIGTGWLVGGASNTGGGVLRQFFEDDDLIKLSAQINPDEPSLLDYYPLIEPGERFPVNDPDLQPNLTPRPADDAAFLHGIFESIARIEARCYQEMSKRGAPMPAPLFSAGGGAQNMVWTAIRSRILKCPIETAQHTEAAIGTAKLIQQIG